MWGICHRPYQEAIAECQRHEDRSQGSKGPPEVNTSSGLVSFFSTTLAEAASFLKVREQEAVASQSEILVVVATSYH